MSKAKFILWGCVAGGALLVIAGFVWVRVFHHGPPPGLMKDIRAGMAARDIKDPDQRLLKYLEGRYGPMSDPTNRQQVFLDFFDVERIKTLQLLVKHSPPEQRQASIGAMAKWVAGYRESLSPEERAALKARFQGGDGQLMLRRATAQYNAQDVHYRGNTAPVISELLRTLNELEQTP